MCKKFDIGREPTVWLLLQLWRHGITARHLIAHVQQSSSALGNTIFFISLHCCYGCRTVSTLAQSMYMLKFVAACNMPLDSAEAATGKFYAGFFGSLCTCSFMQTQIPSTGLRYWLFSVYNTGKMISCSRCRIRLSNKCDEVTRDHAMTSQLL